MNYNKKVKIETEKNLQEQFITPKSFEKEILIEQHKTKENIYTCFSNIVEKYGIDPLVVKKLVSPSLKEELEKGAKRLNLLKALPEDFERK